MEQAIQKPAAPNTAMSTTSVRPSTQSGEIRLARFRQVADPIENEFTQISPADATARKPGLQLGEFLIRSCRPSISAHRRPDAKQVIVQKVREPSAGVSSRSSRTARPISSTAW